MNLEKLIDKEYKEQKEPDDQLRVATVFYNENGINKCKLFCRANNLSPRYMKSFIETFWMELNESKGKRKNKLSKKGFIFGKLIDFPSDGVKTGDIIESTHDIDDVSFLPSVEKFRISAKQERMICYVLNKPFSKFWSNFSYSFSGDGGFESDEETIKMNEPANPTRLNLSFSDDNQIVALKIAKIDGDEDTNFIDVNVNNIISSTTQQTLALIDDKPNQHANDNLKNEINLQADYETFCEKKAILKWKCVLKTLTKYIIEPFANSHGDWITDRHLWTNCQHGFEPRISRICSCFITKDPERLYSIYEVSKML